MFVCPERVIRDGYLVAFAGEHMSEQEAQARGLLNTEGERTVPPTDKAPKPRRAPRKKNAAEVV